MRKGPSFLRILLACFLCVCAFLPAQSEAFSANLLSRLSTRTGPGTQYDEPGTYFQNDWRNSRVTVINAAWDNRNDIWWVQVDFSANGKQFRAYTGLKRVAVDVNTLTRESPMGNATMTSDARAYWGPGRNYVEAKFNVPNHTAVTVYGAENGFVQVEFRDERTATSAASLRRAWVTAAAVSGQWAAENQVPNQGNSYQYCPFCGKALVIGNVYAFCPFCGNSLSGASLPLQPPALSSLVPARPWAGNGVPVSLKSLSGERLRPQCGPDGSYKRFLSRSDSGALLYQRNQIREMRALFATGAFILTEFIYSDGLPRIGYFEQSLFMPMEGVPAIQLVPAAYGTVNTTMNPFDGPGYHYGEYRSCRVSRGDSVRVFFEDRGWYFCEFYTTGNDYGYVQLWLPAEFVNL